MKLECGGNLLFGADYDESCSQEYVGQDEGQEGGIGVLRNPWPCQKGNDQYGAVGNLIIVYDFPTAFNPNENHGDEA